MSDNKAYKKHAIQLVDLKVVKLQIEANFDVDQTIPDEGNFRFHNGTSEYNKDKKIVLVKIGVEMGEGVSENDSPFDLQVELLGVFEVDEEQFPIEHIGHWAERNAPLVLYPYLREHVHGLTSRAGYDGMLLPLFEVPTFNLR